VDHHSDLASTRLLDLLLAAYPDAPIVAVICDNGSSHHSGIPKRWLAEHLRLLLIEGARYSPQDNPVERIWAALKQRIANTAPTTNSGGQPGADRGRSVVS
jgi:transposase